MTESDSDSPVNVQTPLPNSEKVEEITPAPQSHKLLITGIVIFIVLTSTAAAYVIAQNQTLISQPSSPRTCEYQGQTYQVGEEYTTNGDICNNYLCKDTGEWTCNDMAHESDVLSPYGSMSDWKTYKNHGYQIQFPASMTIQAELSGPANKLTTFSDDQNSFTISIPVKNTQSLDEYRYYLDTEPSGETMVANNLPAKVFEIANGYCDAGTCGAPMYVVVTENNGVIYEFIFHGDTTLSELEWLILSTFEFTN